MAVIQPERKTPLGDTGLNVQQWTPLTGSDEGAPIELATFPDRSIQVEGDFGAGGSVAIQGSNDGTNYRTLKDHLGNNLNFTTAGIRSIDQIVRYLKPVGAGAAVALTVTLMQRRFG